MREPHHVGGAAWELWLLLLHRHQLPQGHGAGTCSTGTDAAQHPPAHEDLLRSARALPLGVAHQGTSRPEGVFLLSVRGCESQIYGTPAAKTSRQKLEIWVCLCMCVCTWVCWCDTVFLFLWSLPLAWGPPGESLEL